MQFSIVYPTRNRPEMLEMALRFLERVNFEDFEVVVVDNPSREDLAVAKICADSSLKNLKYVRQPKEIGMVENWNSAFTYTTGDYVAFLTDKMFLLPNTLKKAKALIESQHPEIINWLDATYDPAESKELFGKGLVSMPKIGMTDHLTFDPVAALEDKLLGKISRDKQVGLVYCRGKICFGAYSRELCERIVAKTGSLFFPIAPDYTSMVAALSIAKSAVHIQDYGIIHVNTTFSNGGLTAVHDEMALSYLRSVAGEVSELPIPDLYSSQHNIVAGDYVSSLLRLESPLNIHLENWIHLAWCDLIRPDRKWSSSHAKKEQWNAYKRNIRNEISTFGRVRLKWRQFIKRSQISRANALKISIGFLCKLGVDDLVRFLKRKFTKTHGINDESFITVVEVDNLLQICDVNL